MTDGPQQCALPECNEFVEQPDDGGPPRLYCSPAHRAAARKMRHAARMDSTATQPTSIGSGATQPISGPKAEQQDEPTAAEPPAALAAPRPEPDPGQAPEHEWSPAAAWTITPPALPPAPKERTVRTITSKRVKKQRPVRTAADLKNAASAMRRRAVASVAIASLVAGGASYMVTENIIPTPTTLPPQAAPQPSMEADVWAGQAEVVLASLSSQLDAVAQAEAAWLGLPVDRRAQEPDAVQALKDRKSLLEQQRATLMSQLEALRALPDRTTELTSAQAQLDAVERTLNESTSTAASPDYQEALRQLEEQREMRRQQRDHAAQALADLRSGVEEALSAPLPAEKDKNDTTKVVERVKAVVEGRPDPGDQDDDPEHDAGDGQEPASNQRREDEGEERDDTGTTAPPDPERPSVPDVLAGGVGEPGSDGGGTSPDPGSGNSNGDTDNAPTDPASADNSPTGNAPTDNAPTDNAPADEQEGPVSPIANPLGGLLGGNDSDRSESDERSARDDDNDNRGNSWFDHGDDDKDDRGNSWAGRDDDDDNDDRDNSWFDRGDDDDDRGNSWLGGDDDGNEDRGNSWLGGDDDGNEDRGNSWLGGDDDDANEGDGDRGGLDDLTDGLIGDDRGDDTDERGNANPDDRDEGGDRAAENDDRRGLDDVTDGLIGDDRNEGAEDRDTEDRNAEGDDAGDDAEQASDEDRAGGDEERKRPVGKAERERQRAEENNDSPSEASDTDEGDEESTSDDRDNEDRDNKDQDNKDRGENADDNEDDNAGGNDDRGAGDDDNEDAGDNDDKGDDGGDKGDDADRGDDDRGSDKGGDDGGDDDGDDGDDGGGSDSGGDD